MQEDDLDVLRSDRSGEGVVVGSARTGVCVSRGAVGGVRDRAVTFSEQCSDRWIVL